MREVVCGATPRPHVCLGLPWRRGAQGEKSTVLMRLMHDAPGARRRRKGDREKRNPKKHRPRGFAEAGVGGDGVDTPSSPVI